MADNLNEHFIDYRTLTSEELKADRDSRWARMKHELAGEGIRPQKIWGESVPGFDPALGQDEPALYVLPIHPGRGLFIVCAGGGFVHKSPNESRAVAEFFHRAGLNAAILDYRVRPYDPQTCAVADGLRAVRYVRAHAEEWGIPADRIAIGGFSAGGMLSGGTATRYDAGDPASDDPVARCSSRPDAVLLLYGAFPMRVPQAGAGGYDIEATRKASAVWPAANLRPDSPPFFLFQTHRDDPHGTLEYAKACADRGIEFEIHAFREGPHGGGLYDGADETTPLQPHTARWAVLAQEWLEGYGF